MKNIILILLLSIVSVFGKNIKVVTEEFKPYNYLKDDKIVGLSTEVVEAVLKKAKIDYTITLYPWARAYKSSLKNENILIYSISRTWQREDKFKWVGSIAPSAGVAFFKLKQRDDIDINNLNDAKKYSMCSLKLDVTTQTLTNKGFNVDITYSNDQSIKNLMDKKVDIIPFSINGFYEKIKQLGYSKDNFEKVYDIKSLSNDYYMAFSVKTDDEIVRKVSKVLEEIKKESFYKQILKKYGF